VWHNDYCKILWFTYMTYPLMVLELQVSSFGNSSSYIDFKLNRLSSHMNIVIDFVALIKFQNSEECWHCVLLVSGLSPMQQIASQKRLNPCIKNPSGSSNLHHRNVVLCFVLLSYQYWLEELVACKLIQKKTPYWGWQSSA
jgi:hypothetical protein